ncbi:LuxR family transcriptional regulator [Bradyrhizobium lablabi]|uniref:LuxR family transcriptional regulator n=1 Tax=Bradyrhizobium lablabi TaxID=722472 RepID=A0A0R3N6B4_9BRAD|nr:LuxR family transcriptional regulator [Bradyrhizobium lablabi]
MVGPGQIDEADPASDLSEADFQAWTRTLRELPQRGRLTEADVLAWVEGPLRHFFPFEKFIGLYGTLSGGRVRILWFLSSGHDPEFLAGLEDSFDLKMRGCFEWWVSNRKPFIVDMTGPVDEAGVRRFITRRSLEEIERFSLGAIAAHGIIDPFMLAGTYFSFSGVPGAQPRRTLTALELIAPVLHMLYLHTKQATKSAVDLTLLTDRQRALVDLARNGLSDKEIASQLAISDHTVGNHFRAIYAKLGIGKRSQLIALLK